MDDEAEIRALIGAHFEALGWSEGGTPDWRRFRADFLLDARLFPAARPVESKTLDDFAARMERVAREVLTTFEEHTRGMEVRVFGNIAVVLAASEMIENGQDINRDVSDYLVVKSGGQWRIAAQAWDRETPERPVPPDLL
ncbi:hypothetical protein [Defluviimonas salinarum]|uniref:Nuclear transport factor 2 family protein n=1 Tax=Defluviimonas salinarum TaxID=2992147 RepID=A0ABT3J3A6_9RHOB|nr:hypothetical protein [Defluviimonas salinarum]MCW3782159.1 hypothetical protein [Defluviimonas salinarum]